MAKKYSRYIGTIQRAGDFILLSIIFIISYFISTGSIHLFSERFLLFLLFANAVYLSVSLFLNTYHYYRAIAFSKVLADIWKTVLLLMLIIEAALNLFEISQFSHHFRITAYTLLAVVLPGWRLTFLYTLQLYRKSGYNYRNIIIAGYGQTAEELKTFFDMRPELGYRFFGFFDDEAYATNGSAGIKGSIADIKDFVKQYNIDQIFCLTSHISDKQADELITFADNNLVRIKFLADSKVFHFKNLKIDFYDHLPVLTLRPLPLDNEFRLILKRFFDIFFSLSIIIFILSWLIPIVSLLIKLDSKGPIFFLQKRSGINNRSFWCLKFRTMKINKQEEKQAQPEDERITRIGKILRKTNIDEFPQFINVFLGEMSIVGPRPHMLLHTEKYAVMIDKYMVRHFIKPGITGLSQIKGFRGETTNPVLMQTRIRQDIYYLEHWSFLLDMKIILITIINMIKGQRSAY